jgi:hypothetical protein
MLIIGNGESRKGIKLDNIPGEKIGCNAIFREAKVRHIVCCDRRMVTEAVKKFVNLKSGIWTRTDWKDEFGEKHNINAVPGLWYSTDQKKDQPFHWGSGPYAVYIGCILAKQNETIDMLGFDLHSKSNTVNNIYKGTPNYDSVDSRAVDPSFWIHQISKLFEHYPNRQFRIFNNNDWEMPESWKKNNVSFFNLTQFKEMLKYSDV